MSNAFGYVGYGTVTSPAIMVRDFVVQSVGKKLLSLPLVQPGMKENCDNSDFSEWVVAVNWTKTFSREEAKKFTGAFANQNIVCQLRDVPTIEFLKKEFKIDGAN